MIGFRFSSVGGFRMEREERRWANRRPRAFHAPLLLLAAALVLTSARPGPGADSIASGPATGGGSRGDLILVVGAAGRAEFGEQFEEWARRWERGASQGGLVTTVIGRDAAPPSDLKLLREAITKMGRTEPADGSSGPQQAAAGPPSPDRLLTPLWLVMIGHGTFDGRHAKFNLRGEDVSAQDLTEWLAPVERPLAVITCFSASAPFLDALSAPDRVVLSATKSGAEVNFSRFGGFLSEAINDRQFDLDKDNQVSLLEAFLAAARKTQAYYDAEGRLATEHSLLDDNGDGLGTRAEAYDGLRLVENDGSVAWDGLRAHQWHLVPSSDERRLSPELARRRDELELLIAQLRDRKSTMLEEVYYAELEKLLVEMAHIYATLDDPAEAAAVDATVPSSD